MRRLIGTLTGFAYLVDQDLAALQGFRLSSQSYGVRFAGSRPIAPGWKLGYIASVARQSDYRRNPNRYAASYYLAEGKLSAARWWRRRQAMKCWAPITARR